MIRLNKAQLSRFMRDLIYKSKSVIANQIIDDKYHYCKYSIGDFVSMVSAKSVFSKEVLGQYIIVRMQMHIQDEVFEIACLIEESDHNNLKIKI